MARHSKPYRLYFRKDTGYWFYRLPGGKWRTTGCVKEHEAHAYVMEQVRRGGDQLVTEKNELTLREFAADFFVWGRCPWIRGQQAAGRPFSRVMARNRRAHLERYILPRFGELPLGAIRLAEVEPWLYGLPLANQTKNHLIDTFRTVLNEAVRLEVLERNPLEKLRRPANTYRHRDILSLEECLALFPQRSVGLLRVWSEPRWAALYLTMLTAGIRVGEAAALQWRHVVWSTPAVLLVERAVKADGEIGLPKSNDVRAVFLPRRTKAALAWWRGLTPFPGPEDLVFHGARADRPLHVKTISSRFAPALRAAGIERGERYLTAHSLRHTWVTRCRQLLPEALVQYMAGHKGREVTARYTHLTALERLRAILPEPPDLGRAWS